MGFGSKFVGHLGVGVGLLVEENFLVVIVKGCVSEVSVCLVGAEFCYREEVGS